MYKSKKVSLLLFFRLFFRGFTYLWDYVFRNSCTKKSHIWTFTRKSDDFSRFNEGSQLTVGNCLRSSLSLTEGNSCYSAERTQFGKDGKGNTKMTPTSPPTELRTPVTLPLPYVDLGLSLKTWYLGTDSVEWQKEDGNSEIRPIVQYFDSTPEEWVVSFWSVGVTPRRHYLSFDNQTSHGLFLLVRYYEFRTGGDIERPSLKISVPI